MNLARVISLFTFLFLATGSFGQETVSYSDRDVFEAMLTRLVIDDYVSAGYATAQDNESMSEVLGETQYESTAHYQTNLVSPSGADPNEFWYCAGCNGSFRVSFPNTSIGTATGISAFGLGIFTNGILTSEGTTRYAYSACVRYSSGLFESFELPTLDWYANYPTTERHFWGIVAPEGESIASIHFTEQCEPDGMEKPSYNGDFAITNLTIGDTRSITFFRDGFEFPEN